MAKGILAEAARISQPPRVTDLRGGYS
jgi:hypothetical protein